MRETRRQLQFRRELQSGGKVTQGPKPEADRNQGREDLHATFYRPTTSEMCSEPLYRFIAEYSDIIGAFFFTVTAATRMDHLRNTAARALDEIDDLKKCEGEYQKNDAFQIVRGYKRLFARDLVVGMTNNFLSYVSEMLQIVLRRKPEVLRSSEKLTSEEVLQFTRIKELIAYVADRKVNALAYEGLRGIEAYVNERLGVQLFENESERIQLTILTELRNIHTHNRGHVNEIFLKRVGVSGYESLNFRVGELAHTDFDQFVLLSRNAIDVAMRLDARLCNKFGIRRAPYGKRRASSSHAHR